MPRFYQTIFWILTFVILTLAFGRSFGDLSQAFFFVSFLFPVIVGTSYLVNAKLVPGYLLRRKYFKFFLYFIYALVFSVYLEMLIMILSLILFANFQYSELHPKTTDVVFLTVVLYFFVFLNTIILLVRAYFRGQERQLTLEAEKQMLDRGYLVVKSDRKNRQIPYHDIAYAESLGNYVRIMRSSGESFVTREKISSLHERLPEYFLRIHRSIIVNRNKIQSFNREWITIGEMDLPLSRKYKEEIMNVLK